MIDITGIMAALARLKDMPISKVIRNASRDFVQGAYKATPTAQISKSNWYVAQDDEKKWYIPATQMAGRRIKKNGDVKIKKTRIYKGWSKATWAGVMRELGMITKATPKRLPNVVNDKSNATQSLNTNEPKMTIANQVRIDNFGKQNTQQKHQEMAKAGFALAAKRLVTAYAKMLKEAWR